LDRQKKKLVWAILTIALIQMPMLALMPGINQISTTAFAAYSLGSVQTALALSSLAQPIAALGAAMLINRGIVTKKSVIMVGLCLLAATGLMALVFNTEFWHLIMLSITLGIATGFYISNMFGLMFDNFEPKERQIIAGHQSAVINAGGIAMSLLGGLLATVIWYGGFLMLLIGLPAAALVLFTVPSYRTPALERGKEKASGKLNPRIYYYSTVALLFMMAYSVCGGNLSTHIAEIGDSATAGVAIAFLMGGGVVSGLFFDKLSKKAGDYSMSLAFGAVFVGYMLLSLFPSSLVITFAAVFIVGLSLSIMLPRCIFMVSTLADNPSTSATATALVTIVAPSTGGFLSPIVYTNITTVLFGESTAARYRFVGFVVLAFAIVIALLTLRGKKKS
jgi:MFS family permease